MKGVVKMKKLVALLGMMVLFNVNAYDDSFYFDDAIDIDGDFMSSPADQSEALRKHRDNLERRNEMMVRRRIETLRLQQEREMMRKLNQSMNQTFKNLDNALNNM